MSDLNLLANVASRSPEELEAAESLVELSKEQIINLEAAALTILDLNRLPISEEAENDLKQIFEKTNIDTISEHAYPFIKYGILPPIEIVADEMEVVGGDDDVLGKRKRTPTWRAAEAIEDAAREAAIKNSIPPTAVDTFTDKSYEDLSVFLQSFDVCAPKQASVLMRALFPPAAVDKWTKAMKKNCRDIYEPGGIEAQCNNTILPVNREKDKCYICGFGFYSGVDDPAIAGYELEVRQGVEPTCEHILPIIQAIFFLDLFRQSEKGKISDEKMAILHKEYAWAHRCCNYVKSDYSFLVTKISQKSHYPSWGFNTYQTNRTLSTILNTRPNIKNKENEEEDEETFKGCAILQAQITDSVTWKKDRVDYIRDQKMQSIIDHINSKGNGGIVMMIGYSNCVDSTKINEKFSRVLYELKSGETTESANSIVPPRKIYKAKRNAPRPAPSGKGRTYRARKNRKQSRKTRRHK